jgi:flagellar biosynthetic protein FliS
MIMTQSGLSYRRAAVEGASTIGLMIALFDTLVRDLGRACVALRTNDIETRCREMNHAALVISQLESWLDLKNGGEQARKLSRFYAHLRAKMLEAAATKSAILLEMQINTILHIRTVWQQLDASPLQEPGAEEDTSGLATSDPWSSQARHERIPFSQSA